MASLSCSPSRSKSTRADSSEFFTVNINAGSIETELSNDAAMTEARENRDEVVHRRSNSGGQQRTGGGEEIVAYCTTPSPGRNSGLLSRKMKSRLLDPLEPERMTLKSGCEGEEDEDPFMDEDVPEALSKKINLLNRPLTTLQWVSFIILTAALFCTFKIHVLRIFIGWECLYNTRHERVTENKILPLVTRILICLLVGMFVRLVKTLLVKVLALSFHVSAFFDRIQESLFDQYVVQTMSGPPSTGISREQEGEDDKTVATTSSLPAWFSRFMPMKNKSEGRRSTLDHPRRLTQKNISA
ncbi:unnamed protein product [Cuscuta campestris]|uniref:Uncharacterized protein n=1 Tax=Cuscuta campestris TaxID=132261 RepID=A0A484KE58_9ASTE|nr:unnamed protein product [Cuscuta campestris]